ncbi:hypothetical protein KO527_06110 [Pseudoalteromonas sp. C2R02]|uniref:hypothetical protein n=1 Tax=Pseudoalteromonas sp. C2R02 TaxID=2841565 RepID=UPI001C09B2FC|nr:hypothetical protein [Pseudoalteromonas sp. C2R02]MBU2968917.1 hypothetical protein [Pseudoalteromonas sp. C2R02]
MNYESHKTDSSQIKLTMPDDNRIALIFQDFKVPEKKFVVGAISFVLLCCLTLFSILSHHAPKQSSIIEIQTSMPSLNSKHLKFVDGLLRGQFKYGTWRYINSELAGSKIKSYIQIPLKLQMEKGYQRNYIQKALCPHKNHPLWQHIQRAQLEVHLYTGYKHNSVYAKCA